MIRFDAGLLRAWIAAALLVVGGFFLANCSGEQSTTVKKPPRPPQNMALEFDGEDDYVSVPNLKAKRFTIELWVYRDNHESPHVFFAMGDRGDGTLNWSLEGKPHGPDPRIVLQDAEGQLHVAGPDSSDLERKALPDREWVHLAFAYNGNTLIIFSDGEIVKKTSASFVTATSNDTGVLGNRVGMEGVPDRLSYRHWFKGRLDEVRVWNYPRTQTEIRENRKSYLTGNEDGLIAYYPLNAAKGDTIVNYAGTPDTGVIHGAKWVEGPQLEK